MKNKNLWKNNGTNENPTYDFIYPKYWGENKIFEENKKNLDKIKNRNIENKYEWIEQLKYIPENLMKIMINEMERGNILKSISNNNWPNNGSIVVSFKDKFHNENKKIKGTQWREINDPHYCKEEIAEFFNEVEYLLIH